MVFRVRSSSGLAATRAVGMAELRVLVVDDDVGVRTLIQMLLTLEGIEVYTASNGAEAWAAIQSHSPSFFSLVVLDLQMPVMDGRVFGRIALEQEFRVPILLLSAYGAREAQQEIGAAYAMGKPFDPAILVEVVQRLTLGTAS
jgi:CheY-like chemotaxis protein